jgi:hypothetical protein
MEALLCVTVYLLQYIYIFQAVIVVSALVSEREFNKLRGLLTSEVCGLVADASYCCKLRFFKRFS